MAKQEQGQQGGITRWCASAMDSTVRACTWVWDGRSESPEESLLAAGDEPPALEYGKADRSYTAVTRWFSYLAGAALGVIVLVCVIDIISWKLFDWPFPSQQGLVKHLNVVLVFLAVAYVQMDRGSVAIELLQDKAHRVAKLAIRIFASLLGAGVCFFAAYRGWYYMADLYNTNAVDTGVWRFPIWPFQSTLVLGWFLLGVAFLFTIGRDVANYRGWRGTYARRPGKAKEAASSRAE